MAKFKSIWAWLKGIGKTTTDSSINEGYSLIDTWRLVYANRPKWATYQTKGVMGKITVTRKLTSAAKTIAAELASLCWSERPNIEMSKSLKEVVKNNKILEEMQKNIEYFSALGGMAVKGYFNGEIKVDFVTAEKFVPTSYDGNEVISGRFIDNRVHDSKSYVRVEDYEKTETGYIITSKLYDENNKKVPLSTIPDFADMQEIVELKTNKKLFSYVKFPVANNFDLDSPLGISMFANSLHSLEALDIAYDLLNDELVLGRKRIIVPDSAMKAIFDTENERFDKYFDTNDRVYQALHFEENDTYKITDNSVEIRTDKLLEAIDAHLRMLEFQMGFSAGTFSFSIKEGFKTATEVISDNSKTFKTIQSVVNKIDDMLTDTFEIIEALSEIYSQGVEVGKIEVSWDDSVIEDRNSKAAFQIMLKNSGLQDTISAIMEIYKITEDEAIKKYEIIKAEQSVVEVIDMED